MGQIDRLNGLVGSVAIKAPCRAATTAAITLSGEQTIDGVALVTGDAVLVKDQGSGVDNGIYVVDTGTWNRRQDFDGSNDVVEGTMVKVNAGTVGQGFWYVTTTGSPIPGTDAIAFAQASSVLAVISAYSQSLLTQISQAAWITALTTGAAAAWRTGLGLGDLAVLDTVGSAQIDNAGSLSSTLVGGYLDWSVTGNALTISVKADSGNDPSAAEPVSYSVRDATVTNGKLVPRTITAALSVTVPDTALLGTANSTAFRLWAVIFNDAGTDRLGVINCATISANAGSGYNVTGIYPLAGWGIASSTAVGTGSDAAQTFYTGSAVASKGYTVAGYASWESGLAAAGTWSAGPTKKQAWAPGVPLPGQTVQRKSVRKGTSASGNAGAVPNDNTIPQITEGNQLMDTLSTTASSAANALRVQHVGDYSDDGSTINFLSLFQDAAANALACRTYNTPAANTLYSPTLVHWMLAATTSVITLRIRIGNVANNTFRINSNGGDLNGAQSASILEVEEVMT